MVFSRKDGIYQWDATVQGVKNNMRQALLVTVFCDTRREAIDACCEHAVKLGYEHPTVDLIKRIR
jgi:hypothetical protein